MARTAITPTTQALNTFTTATFTAIGIAANAGWSCAQEDFDRAILVARSSETSVVTITMSSPNSSAGSGGADWVYGGCTEVVSIDIGASGISLMAVETARYATTEGINIDCSHTGSTALAFACVVYK